ncbi:anti-sigma-D factor RsdA [Mycobacterium shinjukuense]|uniref:Uncharacterized protein n=1 Tax=Mycobacterium shinjukuense TaxID=398694 RepID=A0A7I7MR94_9MYCO|nr:hypothetical protein BST45_00945 [Mycobacterium shinjukuense]BBX74741.1 hypothetical protein MSHI_26470 [Mycobacterium shinjukuense]
MDDVARTDLLLDALAERAEVNLDDPRDDALAALLGDWRDDLRWPPASALVSPDEAVEALLAGVALRRRARRGLAAIGSVAAALLLLSGFGAVVADARPGDPLYGLHKMMFTEPRVGDDQIVLSAKAELAKVEQMIAQGQWDQAQTQLAEVSSTLRAVNDDSRKQNLLDEVNQLNTKVEKRDPHATVPASSPARSEPSRVAPADSAGNSSTPLAPETGPAAAPSATPEPPTTPEDAGITATPPVTSPSASPSPTSKPTPTPSSVTSHATTAGTPTSSAAGATTSETAPGPLPGA